MKKLELNKKTISVLKHKELGNFKGGAEETTAIETAMETLVNCANVSNNPGVVDIDHGSINILKKRYPC